MRLLQTDEEVDMDFHLDDISLSSDLCSPPYYILIIIFLRQQIMKGHRDWETKKYVDK